MTVPTEHLLILAGILFSIGVAGFFLRRNLIIVLMSVELMLNAANITFIAAARQHSSSGELNLEGPIQIGWCGGRGNQACEEEG